MIFRTYIFMTFYIELNRAIFQISTIPKAAVIGEDLSLICVYASTSVVFRRGNDLVCVIQGHYPNNTCDIPGSYITNYTYNCTSTTYTLNIPGSFLKENLHGTNWTCSNLYDTNQIAGIILSLNVPITSVTLSSLPVNENPVKVIKNQPKQFTCRTNAGRPSSRIQWYLGDTNITSYIKNQSNENLNGKVTSSSQLEYIGNTNDEGKLMYCTAINVERYGVRSLNKSISVLYSPSSPLITQSPTGPVNEFTVINITCEIIGGNPLANITWQCNGSTPVNSIDPVRNDKAISKVRLEATRANNGNTCRCTGLHPAWTKQDYASVVLNIRYTPEVPSIIQTPNGPIIEHTRVVLTCEISGGNPLATITWICVGLTYTSQRSTVVTNKTLSSIELNVTRNNDGKECICRGKHPLWAPDKETRHPLIVYYSPTNFPSITQTPTGLVDEGTPIILTCEVPGGKPLSVITWQCDGSSQITPTTSPSINTSVSSVQLTVNKKQNGEQCICFAYHPTWIKNESSIILLDVGYPPVQFYPITQTPSGPIIAGNTVHLRCEIFGGNPLANISWQCDGLPYVSSTSYPLGVRTVSSIEKHVTKDDNGKTCSCKGHHHLWVPDQHKKSQTLNVYYSTSIQILNTQPVILIENRTLVLACTETDGNPKNATFEWFKFNNITERAANHSIKEAKATDAGNYTCHGSNGFGKQSKATVEVHVLYSPRVSALSALYGPTISENDTTVLQCTIQSNPPSNVEWLKQGSNSILQGNRNQFQSNYTINNASCMDTSNYTCKAHNKINNDRYTTMKDIELFVKCSPRRYDQDGGSTDHIGLAVGQDLIIQDRILSYPIGDITWFFQQDMNTSEEILVSASDCEVYNIFDHQICFSRLNLTEKDFGVYSAVVVNAIGSAKFTYTVDPQGKPYKSTNVSVTCGTLSAELSWTTGFNGGQTQTFYIITTDKDGLQLITGTGIVGNNKGETKKHFLTMPTGPFRFDVFGNNTYGNATMKGTSCTVHDLQETDSVIGLAAGFGCGIALLLIIIVAVVLFYRKRVSKKNDDDTKLFKRLQKKINEDNDDELKDNPLYVTSDTNAGWANGPIYSTVDKTEKTETKDVVKSRIGIQGSVYAEVHKVSQKNATEDKKARNEQKRKVKEKKGKDSRDIEMANVYGNTDRIHQGENEDGVYANTKSNSDSKNINNIYSPKKNKDGLIYADLELDSSPNGTKFVIRGLENRTNYAIIDLNVKVDPLPSDNDEEDQEQKND